MASDFEVETAEFRKRIRVMGNELLDFLISTVRNKKVRISTRLIAARELLDRGYGKPTQSTEISAADGVINLILSEKLKPAVQPAKPPPQAEDTNASRFPN